MKHNKVIRNMDQDTVNKLNYLCAIMKVSQSELIKLLVIYYINNNKEYLIKKLA